MLIVFVLAVIALGLAALTAMRWRDLRADKAAIDQLLARRRVDPAGFAPAMLDDLPEPAQRFFRFAIADGARLRVFAEIEMVGELGLGTKDDPRYQAMSAHQILAPPYGFVWQVATSSWIRLAGSDVLTRETSWGRFRLFDLVPVARSGGSLDHRRSSFGRMVGEGLFWSPAAFLPAARAGWDDLTWQATGSDKAAVTVRLGELEQRAEIELDADGRPLRVVFQRWSNENPERTYRLQPFGGDLDAFKSFDGFTLPTRVVGGNHYGTDDYHPFFHADGVSICFSSAR